MSHALASSSQPDGAFGGERADPTPWPNSGSLTTSLPPTCEATRESYALAWPLRIGVGPMTGRAATGYAPASARPMTQRVSKVAGLVSTMDTAGRVRSGQAPTCCDRRRSTPWRERVAAGHALACPDQVAGVIFRPTINRRELRVW